MSDGQENFFDAVRNDPDMTPEQKAYWLRKESNSADDYPSTEQANALLRALGRDPADVGKIGELFAKNCMLEHDLKETKAQVEMLKSRIAIMSAAICMIAGNHIDLFSGEVQSAALDFARTYTPWEKGSEE